MKNSSLKEKKSRSHIFDHKVFIYPDTFKNVDSKRKEKIKESENVSSIRIPTNEDVSFFKNGEKKNFNTEDFSVQHRFWKRNGDLKQWDEGVLHLNSSIFASLSYAYKNGFRKIFIDAGVLHLVESKFEKKVLYQLLEQLKTSRECNIQVLQGDYGKSFFIPKGIGEIENQRVFEELIFDNYERFDFLMKKTKKFPVFLNKNIPYDFDNLKTVSVVGNSRTLHGSENRNKIDSNECVVRLNSAPVKGYEDDVGRLTTFRFVNKLFIDGNTPTGESLEDLNKLSGSRFIFDVQNDSDILKIPKKIENQNEIYFLSDEISTEFQDLADLYNLERLSTGLKAILLFGILAEELNVFGFDFYEEKDGGYHYWEKLHDEDLDNTHDWSKEEKIMDYLTDKFNIKIID